MHLITLAQSNLPKTAEEISTVVLAFSTLALLAGLAWGQFRRGGIKSISDGLQLASQEIDVRDKKIASLEQQLAETRAALSQAQVEIVALRTNVDSLTALVRLDTVPPALTQLLTKLAEGNMHQYLAALHELRHVVVDEIRGRQ